jgi:hypothetical protein
VAIGNHPATFRRGLPAACRFACTVNENVGGYYFSKDSEVTDDPVSIPYSHFPMNWDKQTDRGYALNYCATLQGFLLKNLWEEENLVTA